MYLDSPRLSVIGTETSLLISRVTKLYRKRFKIQFKSDRPLSLFCSEKSGRIEKKKEMEMEMEIKSAAQINNFLIRSTALPGLYDDGLSKSCSRGNRQFLLPNSPQVKKCDSSSSCPYPCTRHRMIPIFRWFERLYACKCTIDAR